MPVTRQFVQTLWSLRYEDLSPEVLSATKRALLDTLLVAWAGMRGAGLAELRQTGLLEGRAESTAWGGGDRLPAASAAFLNCVAASALDYDTLNLSVHADAVTVAAALAVAERQQSSGRDFLRAVVLGNETICRLALSACGVQRGWSPTALYGSYGAAMAASSLLKLDLDATLDSLGLAFASGAGNQQATIERALSRRIQPGLAARDGVAAALMAEAGISGAHQVFEGQFGLWALYQPGDAHRLMSGLGHEFKLLHTGFKKYPVCGASHAAIAALESLLAEHPVQASCIERIEVGITPLAMRLVGGAFEPEANPGVSAQYCLQYALAATICYGRMALPQLAPAAVLGEGVGALAKRVHVAQMSANELDPLALAPAQVKLILADGRQLQGSMSVLPGSDEAPLSPVELREKLDQCALAGLRPMAQQELEALIATVDGLDAGSDPLSLPRMLIV